VSLDAVFDRFLPQIEAELREIVRIPHHSLGTYYGMMRYHLGWTDESLQPVQVNSGKRLRPVLCLLSCEAAGGDPVCALPAACAVELVHNFSLVHDDIQDGSHYRRGRRAVWDIWGAPHGINVGDGLFVLARLALHRLADNAVPLERCQAVTQVLDRACLALCEGQFFDMSFEDRVDVDLDQYLWMIGRKTAALFAAAAEAGALLATDDAGVVESYRVFGYNLGLAFQIQDDMLGTWGDEQVTGKSAATDIRDKKKALPAVYGLSYTPDRQAARELARLYAREGPLDEDAVQSALAILEVVDAHQYAERMAEDYLQKALDGLAQSGAVNPAESDLRKLAVSLLDRVV
jgi:geranylgeranyl diphosphate synthase type I